MTDTDTSWLPGDVELPDDPLPFAPAPEPEVYDRSTIERYAKCPFQGWAVETGLVNDASMVAASGQEGHAVMSEMVGAFIQGNGGYEGRGEAIDAARQAIPMARPDVQADMAGNTWPSVYSFASFLMWKTPPDNAGFSGDMRSPLDILRWQGGKDERDGRDDHDEKKDRRGQITHMLLPATNSRGEVRITTEVDLLLAGESATELVEVDFKRFKHYTASDIHASFQFRCHAWILFDKYPTLEQLRVSVWNLPKNCRTTEAVFTRRDLENIEGVLLSAVEYRRRIFEAMAKPGAADNAVQYCWPDPEKCTVCPAVLECPRACRPCLHLNADPARFARDTELLEIQLADRKKHLRLLVDQTGDIPLGDGRMFGLDKPQTPRRPSAASYGFYQGEVEQLPDAPERDGKQIKDELETAFTEGSDDGELQQGHSRG